MSGNVTFPPETQIPYSARKEQLLTVMFLGVRRALTDQYRNPDGTPLASYHETLGDREALRSKVLDYELSQGWLTDDRAIAQVITHPAVQNGATVSATNGTPPNAPQAPVQVQQPQIGFAQPQPVASPVQAIAAAQQQMAAPPQQAAPPVAPPTTGFKRPAPKLATAVAPPPPPAPVAVPQPPPGAQVLSAPIPVQPAQPPPAPMALAAPIPMAPIPAPAAAPAPQVSVATVDLAPVIVRVDEVGKGLTAIADELEKQKTDFKTVVGNLSGQTNETNKVLAELKKNQDIMMTAVHWMFLSSPACTAELRAKIGNIIEFKTELSKYLPQ